MNPVAAATMGGGVIAAYLRILVRQIRSGEIGIPFGTINPIVVRRIEHPVAFLLCAVMLVAVTILIFGTSLLILARAR
jgi:hypothetical protein